MRVLRLTEEELVGVGEAQVGEGVLAAVANLLLLTRSLVGVEKPEEADLPTNSRVPS